MSAPPRPAAVAVASVAITLLLLAHARLAPGAPALAWLPVTRATGIGLFLLFCGQRLTEALLDEKQRTGTIALPPFYARGATLLLPPLYLFLAAMLLARALGAVTFGDRSAAAAALLGRNYASGDFVLDHLWAPSLLAQFALPLPLLVRATSRRATTIAMALLFALWPLVRLWRHGSTVEGPGLQALDTTGMETLALGALLACSQLTSRPRRLPLVDAPGAMLLPAILLVAAYRFAPHTSESLAFLLPLVRNLASLLLLTSLLRRTARAPWIPSWPTATLAALAYPLYLWQQPFVAPGGTAWIAHFPQNLAALALAAVAARGLDCQLRRSAAHFLATRVRRGFA